MRKRRSNNKSKQFLGIITIIICIAISFTFKNDIIEAAKNNSIDVSQTYLNIDEIPEYTDKIYVTLNNNIPYFVKFSSKEYVYYGIADSKYGQS